RRVRLGTLSASEPAGSRTFSEIGECMALVAPAQVPQPGFYLAERGGEWDEVFCAVLVPGHTDWLAYTTTEDGSAFQWCFIRPVANHWHSVPLQGAGGLRTAPAGVPGAAINWICTPPAAANRWIPSLVELATLIGAAHQHVTPLAVSTYPAGYVINQPGSGMPLVGWNPPLGPGPVGGGGMAPAAGGGAAAPVAAGAALGLHAGGAGQGPPVQQEAFDMGALQQSVLNLQAMAQSSANGGRSDKKDKKKDKKDKDKKSKKDKKKKKKRHGSSSSDTSSSSRSRSRSGSSSSNSSSHNKALRWKDSGKSRHVSFGQVHQLDMEKFKKRGDVVAYAAKNPGALTAHFLAAIYARLSKGHVTKSGQLREASVAAWAGQYTGLSEVRDLREVMTLANIMDSINRREVAHTMDVLSQRIVAIQLARRKGGSWDKAELVELVPSGNTVGTSSSVSPFFRYWHCSKHLYQYILDEGLSMSSVFPLPLLRNDASTGQMTCRVIFSNTVLRILNLMHAGRAVQSQAVLLGHPLRRTGGEKGGIPPSAGAVDLAEVLRQFAPEMSQQVLEPSSLLLKPADRPKRLKRGYVFLHVSYPKLVKKAVKAKLHRLVREDQVARHNGRRVQEGAFAVPKDDVEDRVIADPEVNQLLDPVKLPRPRFAYVPRMRALTAPRGGKLLLSKRDARHYFHCLRIGKKWGRWLCGPPVRDDDGSPLFPAAQAAPMGFGPSAVWAQAVTDKITLDADLPHASRVHPGQIIPDELPVWGSIVDDIWALEHVGDRGEADVGPVWMNRAEAAWERDGVESNVKKKIDGQAGQEVQGYYVHATGHWIGTSHDKRRQLMQASIEILMSPKVLVGDVDRLEVYPWLHEARDNVVRVRALPDAVWLEIFWSTMLLPYAQFDISSPWTTRVECTDSSMTGLGRAWATMPEAVVRHMARLADCPGVYTNLDLPWGISLDSVGRCPLQRLKLPSMPLRWFEVSAPATPDHIYPGEADAANWSVEDRLRRPGEVGGRFLQPMDSACVIGAFCKGRSASRRLNKKCRKHGAIVLAGKLEGFYPWVPSADNPADGPSRIYEPDKTPHHRQQPDAYDVDVTLPPGLADWAGTEIFFLHFCSGPRRPGD
ncbi:unnamed protein product, partial [Polarella glacialis]